MRRDSIWGNPPDASAKSSQIESPVEPIRLGGRAGRKRVLSLDAKPIPADKFASPVPERVDVDRLRRELRLSPDEDQYFVANRIDLIPRRRLAAHLDWEPAKCERVRFREIGRAHV